MTSSNPFLNNGVAPQSQAPVQQQPVQQGQPQFSNPAQQQPVQQNQAPVTAPQFQAPTQQPVQQNYQQPVQNQAAATAQMSTPASSSDPFANPTGGGDGSKISDELNQAVLMRPTEYIPEMNTTQGKTDAVRCDWIVLTGPNMGQVRSQSLIFQTVLKRELKARIGSAQPFLVGVVVLGEARGGNNAPYLLAPADDQVRALAAQAAQANNWI